MAVVLGDRFGVVGWNGSENFGKRLATGFAGILFCGTSLAEFECAAGCESIAVSGAAFADDGDEVGILVLRTHGCTGGHHDVSGDSRDEGYFHKGCFQKWSWLYGKMPVRTLLSIAGVGPLYVDLVDSVFEDKLDVSTIGQPLARLGILCDEAEIVRRAELDPNPRRVGFLFVDF